MELDQETERGVQMFMAENGIDREEAMKRILRDWLIGNGYVPLDSGED